MLFSILVLELAIFAVFFLPAWYGAYLFHHDKAEQALAWFRWWYRLSRLIRTWRGMAAMNMSACHIALGDLAAALPYTEEAIRETTRFRENSYHALALAQEGMILARLGESEKAQQRMDEAFASPLPRRYRPWIEQYAAVVHLNAGRFEEAERLMQGLLAAKKTRPDLRVTAECAISTCHYFRGDTAAALETARRAAALPTRRAWVHAYALGECLLYLAESGETEAARKIEAELRPLLPNLPPQVRASILRAAGQLALRTNDLDKARACAEQAVALDPNPNAQAAALLIEAEVFAARHNRHRAQTLCEDVLRLEPLDFYRQRAHALQNRLSGQAATATLPASQEQTITTAFSLTGE